MSRHSNGLLYCQGLTSCGTSQCQSTDPICSTSRRVTRSTMLGFSVFLFRTSTRRHSQQLGRLTQGTGEASDVPRKTCAPPKCCHYAATTQGWVNTLARVVAKLRFGIEIIAEINNITFLKFILPSDHEVKNIGSGHFHWSSVAVGHSSFIQTKSTQMHNDNHNVNVCLERCTEAT